MYSSVINKESFTYSSEEEKLDEEKSPKRQQTKEELNDMDDFCIVSMDQIENAEKFNRK